MVTRRPRAASCSWYSSHAPSVLTSRSMLRWLCPSSVSPVPFATTSSGQVASLKAVLGPGPRECVTSSEHERVSVGVPMAVDTAGKAKDHGDLYPAQHAHR